MNDIQEKALWKFEAEIDGNKIIKFNYKFMPYSSMDKLKERNISTSDINENDLILEGIDLKQFNIGKVKFDAYVFDRSPKIIKLWNQEPKYLTDYLDINGWVRVYRDWLRIYDYWEQWNDWLELDKKRINNPVGIIGNKNILASVRLDRLTSSDLIEKTNREGFTENDAYFTLRDTISVVLQLFTQQRNMDKSLIREFYEGSAKSEPVNYEINALEDLISENFNQEKIEGAEKEN